MIAVPVWSAVLMVAVGALDAAARRVLVRWAR